MRNIRRGLAGQKHEMNIDMKHRNATIKVWLQKVSKESSHEQFQCFHKVNV